MKIFSVEQIRNLDAQSIAEEPISSIDLMERAATAMTSQICQEFSNHQCEITLFCGNGNNGGDGLAMARQLTSLGFVVRVIIDLGASKRSPDNQSNLDRLAQTSVTILDINEDHHHHDQTGLLLIDAVLGTGLNRPATGAMKAMIESLNSYQTTIWSVDIPSGMRADGPSMGAIVKADHVLALQSPKLAFFFAESAPFIKSYQVVDIGLLPEAMQAMTTETATIESEDARALRSDRDIFSHKGHYGHALLIAGSRGKGGAAILAARAAMRSGLGLLTCHLPKSLEMPMHCSLPEAMISIDQDLNVFSSLPKKLDRFTCLGIGPGLGTEEITAQAFARLLSTIDTPLVIDADALNLLAKTAPLWSALPTNSILTPHPGEFRRLAGDTEDSWQAWEAQQALSKEHQVTIVLKGAYTKITTPTGQTWINTTGNPGMSTAGSGDVLTGILTALLARGQTAEQAACLGVYLHGLSGDIAAKRFGAESLIASDIVDCLPTAFSRVLANQT